MQSVFQLLYVLQVNLDVFLQKKTKWKTLFIFPSKFSGGKKITTTNFPKILYRHLLSMPPKLWGSVYRKSLCKAIIQLVISWSSFDLWYVRYHVVDGASFLGLIQLVSNFSSWIGSHCICRHKTSQKIIMVLYILVLTVGNCSCELRTAPFDRCNTISTISNYGCKAVLRAVLTYFQKFRKEYATTEGSNWPVHKQIWSLHRVYLSL